MGDPRHQKKKYLTPSHPFRRLRIDAEKALKKEYGLKNKKEIWRISTKLQNFKRQAKRLIALKTEQARKEEQQLMQKVRKLGIIAEASQLSDVLNINVKDLMERRLQTLVFKKKMARSLRQARQLVSHGHISVGSKKITVPSYLVKINEEADLTFSENSVTSDAGHPIRALPEKGAPA